MVLRMAVSRTLGVVRSLQAAGIDAWTPIGMRRRFRPRSTKYDDIEAPLLPTFAFAPAAQLGKLLAIAHAPGSPHPPFTVFQRGDVFPVASESALLPLRQYEIDERARWDDFLEAKGREDRRKRKKYTARAYVMGQRVRVEKPAFEGLAGKIVEIRKNGDLVLEFTGFLRGTTVPSCDVAPIRLTDEQPKRAQAA